MQVIAAPSNLGLSPLRPGHQPGTWRAPDDLARILTPFVADRRCRGMTVTVFDPDLDPDGRCATTIVELLGRLPFPSDKGA